MATMNISLPDPMRDWVESRLATGLYANNSDYVRDLIRQDQLRTNKLAVLQQAITAGLESGEAGELDMQNIKQQARAKAELKAD
ncbi:MAG: type II toxin-antitoxin system ParD family antitoxin [Pseudomonas sp.]